MTLPAKTAAAHHMPHLLLLGLLALAVLGGLVVMALDYGGAQGDRTGTVFLPEMDRSIPYDAYDANAVTRDGGTLLLPPEGTVPVDFTPTLYGPGPEEAARAGRELKNPLAPTPEALARGAQVFGTFCAVCHGSKGDGDGSVVGPGRFRNPPSLVAGPARKIPVGRLFHIITRGQGDMPAHGLQVRPMDRWRVVLHLLKLQGRLAEPAPTEGANQGANQGANR